MVQWYDGTTEYRTLHCHTDTPSNRCTIITQTSMKTSQGIHYAVLP
jgi:hypothetical protein